MINEAVKAEVRRQFSAGVEDIWYSIDRQVKRAMIQQIMHECRNNKSAAAKKLDINRATLNAWINDNFSANEIKYIGIES